MSQISIPACRQRVFTKDVKASALYVILDTHFICKFTIAALVVWLM